MGDKRKISEMAAESEAIDRKGSRKSKKVARVEKEEKRDQKTRDQEASDTNDTVLQNGEVNEEGEKKEKEKTKKGKGRVHQSSTEDPEVANDQSTKNKKRKRDKKTKMDNIEEESHLVPEDPMQNIETITKPDETETMNKKDEKEKKLNESKRRSDVSKNEAKETADMYAETEKHKKIKTSKKENKQNEDRTISAFESDKEPDANADIQTTDTGCSEHEGLKDHVYSREPKDADDKNQNKSEYHDMNKRNIRFICFIGNLPYSADLAAVQNHFSKISPSQVRLATERDGKKSRGFAFVEFDNYDRMKTCLKLYHHSTMDDGKGGTRRINVDLSAGGGGSKSEIRKGRIYEKNAKLHTQRQRTAKLIQVTKRKAAVRGDKVDNDDEESKATMEESWVHPSRRNRVPGR